MKRFNTESLVYIAAIPIVAGVAIKIAELPPYLEAWSNPILIVGFIGETLSLCLIGVSKMFTGSQKQDVGYMHTNGTAGDVTDLIAKIQDLERASNAVQKECEKVRNGQ